MSKFDLQYVLGLLDRLHRPKDLAYGDAWRKRGEVIGIFCNIARKFDRLLVAMEEDEPSSTESLADTLADLSIYAAKYLTWLAEMHPHEFEKCSPHISSAEARADRGPDALTRILTGISEREHRANRRSPNSIADSATHVRRSFSSLEEILTKQSEGRSQDLAQKVELAWNLTYSSIWLLMRVGLQDSRQLRRLEDEISRMEGK